MPLGSSEPERTVYLHAWSNVGIRYTLNPNTGAHSWYKWVEPQVGDASMDGIATMESVFGLIRLFYAIYAFDGRLYFQAGKRKWDITDAAIETRYWCWFGLTSRFCLILDGQPVHRATLLHPSRARWMLMDPTYDGIDFDSDHFLFFLSKQLKNEAWRNRLLSGKSAAHYDTDDSRSPNS